MSVLAKSETLGLSLNTWISDDKYSVYTSENLPHSFKTLLFEKQKKACHQFFITYMNSTKNFE